MLRILLLDDNPNDRLLVTRELHQAFPDVAIELAINATELQAQLEAGNFDLVITDYQLRWSDGLEVLVAAKTRYPERPVIMFTDSGDEEVAVEGMKRGLSDYVPKRQPFHRLSIAVREALHKQQIQRDYKTAMEALKASEEQFRLAMEAAELGFWDWNIATDEVTWSYNHTRLMGVTPEAPNGTYASFLQCVHADDRPMVDYTVRQAVEQAGDYEAEFRVVWPDGSTHWLVGKGRVFSNEAGKARRMIGVLRDTTDRRLAEEAVRQQARELARVNRIKDEFLAVLSHELRSPLNPILGWAKLLQTRKYDEASTLRALKTIERNAKLQTQLIEDLLDVSRIMQGKLHLDVTLVNLITCIEAAIETMRLAAEAKSIVIETVLNPAVSVVSGDASRLQQVVWNLLSNAIKFTPSGGHVTIQLDAFDREARIQIKDTGKGIAADFLPYVFDYFRQADASISRAQGGLRLGLAIVRHLIELHGGTVSAESAGEGQGATFTVCLPLLQVKSNEIPTSPLPLPDLSARLLLGLRVLVVDDEADSRDFLQLLLENQGAQALGVDSASAAIALLPEFQPDVLVSDIGMPGTDGYTLMRQIRALPVAAHLPAIALTAYARDEDRQEAIAAGFQQHVAKPVEPSNLINAIVQLAEKVE